MANLETIKGLFRRQEEYLATLRELAQLPKAELLADRVRLGAAKYYLQVAVECCIDIANHLIAQRNWRTPQSYAESFAVLAENDVIPAELLETTRRMVGMRNRLVHLYWEVDAESVYETLQGNLSDLQRFKAAVCAYLCQNRMGVT